MDDSDFNITLNTTSFGDHLEKTRVKITRAERKQKKKETKLQRKQAQRADSADSRAVKRKTPPSADSDKDAPPTKKFTKRDNAPSNTLSGGHKKSEEVISSLFRHNPDIPNVKSSSVPGKKEEVFASTKFSGLPLFPHLISNLEEKMELTMMTRVQQLSIPVILQGNDVLVKSQTGSGKTLAYAVPIVHTLASLPRKLERSHGPYALVIVPTRELAIQSYETFQKLLKSCVWVVGGCLMGGENRQKEKSRLRKGINVLVTTPGRLLDHLKHTSCLSVDNVRWLVIDEADRLLELGYEKDIAEIVTILNTRRTAGRQTILLSATLTAGVERLSGMALKNHQSIDASDNSSNVTESPDPNTVGDEQQGTFTVPDKLKQHFVMVPCKLRLVTLAAFILWKCKAPIKKSKMVVFLNTQNSVDFHHQLFTEIFNTRPAAERNFGAVVEENTAEGKGDDDDDIETVELFKLHGDMAQKDRTEVFQDFSVATSGVLLCTDVASRGLHLPKVDWIVQYTTPGATVDYIHRVGRTARAGKQGNSLLFLMPSEVGYVQELNKHNISLTETSMQDILSTLLSAIHDLPTKHHNSKRQQPRTLEEASTYLQDRFEEKVVHDRELQSSAVKGYQSFVQAYATYPAHLKDIFSMKNLHLGHVAKSFALRKAPSRLVSRSHRAKAKGKGHKPEGHPKLKFDFDGAKDLLQKKKGNFSAHMSEFSGGLPSKKKKRKHKAQKL